MDRMVQLYFTHFPSSHRDRCGPQICKFEHECLFHFFGFIINFIVITLFSVFEALSQIEALVNNVVKVPAFEGSVWRSVLAILLKRGGIS
jgi:hypothetical protein